MQSAYASSTSLCLDRQQATLTRQSNLGLTARFVRQGARPEAILGDGLRLAFYTCASMEGRHYLGRRVGDNKLLFHMYQYFDIEFEPTCRDEDLEADGTGRR
jgi:hypothetical protein